MRKIFFVFFSLCLILCGCTSSTVTTQGPPPDEKTLGWGFRRTDNGPEFTQGQHAQMKKYKCIYKEETDEKNIYLTFDEGYENGYTPAILDTLRKKGVKAAFFVTAPYVKENPDLIKRMVKDGHIVGNHTVNHPSLPSVTDSEKFKNELFELDRLIYDITGTKPCYLRPPKGEYNERTLSESSSLGYTNVFWSDAFVDWENNITSDEAHKKVTQNLHPGEVLLLHAVSRGNAEALEKIIDTAHANGYTFKPLNEYKK